MDAHVVRGRKGSGHGDSAGESWWFLGRGETGKYELFVASVHLILALRDREFKEREDEEGVLGGEPPLSLACE